MLRGHHILCFGPDGRMHSDRERTLQIMHRLVPANQVLYVPAARDPSRQLRNVRGTLLARLLNAVQWSENPAEAIEGAADSIEGLFAKERGVELILQDESRRLAIDARPMRLQARRARWTARRSPPRQAQPLLRSHAREALVAETKRQLRRCFDGDCPFPRLRGLGAFRSVHVEWQSYDQHATPLLGSEASDHLSVVRQAARAAAPLHCVNRPHVRRGSPCG
jgi:hypothetical protein